MKSTTLDVLLKNNLQYDHIFGRKATTTLRWLSSPCFKGTQLSGNCRVILTTSPDALQSAIAVVQPEKIHKDAWRTYVETKISPEEL